MTTCDQEEKTAEENLKVTRVSEETSRIISVKDFKKVLRISKRSKNISINSGVNL